MSQAVMLNFTGDRGCAFDATISRVGIDLTGAAFRMQVRQKPDAPGSPIISLTSSVGGGITLSYGGTDTIANHIAAGRLTRDILTLVNPATDANYANSDSVAVSVISIHADYTLLSNPNLPLASELGNDWIGAWDMLIGGAAAGFEDKWFYGTFTVRGTVTQ